MKQISPNDLDVISVQLDEAQNCISDVVQFLCTNCNVDKNDKDWKGMAQYIAEYEIPVVTSRLNVISRDLMYSIKEIKQMVDQAFQNS